MGTTVMKVLLIIAGAMVFGTPIYFVLAAYLGISNATIILLSVVVFIIIRLYFNRRRIAKPITAQPFRSTGTTHHMPQKYGKHRRESYSAAVNRRRNSELTPLQRNLLKILQLTLKPLLSVAFILQNTPKGDIKRYELVHQLTRNCKTLP